MYRQELIGLVERYWREMHDKGNVLVEISSVDHRYLLQPQYEWCAKTGFEASKADPDVISYYVKQVENYEHYIDRLVFLMLYERPVLNSIGMRRKEFWASK